MSLIEIENVSKRYFLSHEKSNPYASLREILSDWIKQSYSKNVKKTCPEEFWALREINLNIQAGDRIGILGHNGAGKSTLLKLLSRITEPTTGRIKIKGRVASLLEVGTGFHPDLTGRENILLNGAIMGMNSQEMRRKFDEIVAFADIEQFLDTQIKRYSSGMYMRLGFAIAAHLNADILIVDEVLAVGDAAFQEKCLKKMNEIGSEGRTVIFVSHNINSVLSLCNKGILLEKGNLLAFEPIDQCIHRYICSCPLAGLSWQGDVGDEHLRVYQFFLESPRSDISFFCQNEKTQLNLSFEVVHPHADLNIAFSILNAKRQYIARSRVHDHPKLCGLVLRRGMHQLTFELDLSLFHPGEYRIQLEASLLNRKKILQEEVMLKFAVFGEGQQEKDGICLGNRWLHAETNTPKI